MKIRALLPLALAFALAACSDDPSTADSGSPQDATVAPDATETHADATTRDANTVEPDGGIVNQDATPSVDVGFPRDPNCPAAASWVATVSGTLVDETGAPSQGSKAQLCVRSAPNDILTCLRPADSGADGKFTVLVPSNVRCVNLATMRFLRPLEDRAVGYCAIDISGGSEGIQIPTAYQVIATTRATNLPPLGDDTMRRTVTFADGLELDVVPHDYFPGAGEYADLSATRVSPASYDACILAGQPSFDGVFAFSPEGDLSGRAAVRIPNSTGLAANRAVAVWVLGGLGCTSDDGATIEEGTWYRLEDTTVSADGTTIAVTPGVPCMSWLAYRGL